MGGGRRPTTGGSKKISAQIKWSPLQSPRNRLVCRKSSTYVPNTWPTGASIEWGGGYRKSISNLAKKVWRRRCSPVIVNDTHPIPLTTIRPTSQWKVNPQLFLPPSLIDNHENKKLDWGEGILQFSFEPSNFLGRRGGGGESTSTLILTLLLTNKNFVWSVSSGFFDVRQSLFLSPQTDGSSRHPTSQTAPPFPGRGGGCSEGPKNGGLKILRHFLRAPEGKFPTLCGSLSPILWARKGRRKTRGPPESLCGKNRTTTRDQWSRAAGEWAVRVVTGCHGVDSWGRSLSNTKEHLDIII